MQTVILAAGRGTRMSPLTDVMPKPMLPVADRPLVAHVADAAIAAGATEIILVIGYRGETVRDYFGNEYQNVAISYVQQDEQRGTADAVRAARSVLHDDWVAVVNGDLLVEEDALGPLFRNQPSVGSTRVDHPSNYGVLDIDERGYVGSVIEKPATPPSNLANAGAYTFPTAALSHLDDLSESSRGEYELTDLLNHVAKTHDITPVQFDRWLDVGRPWELLEATEWKLGQLPSAINGDVSGRATLRGLVCVESEATIREGVTIEGPVYVKAGAQIGPNAYVRGPSVIGEDATVGHAVEVKQSILFPGATVGHLAYVGDSILGPDVNFGAGTNVANLRHDDEPVRTVVKGERVSTGRRKYGVVVGPDVKTGIDTNLNAGIVLPTGSYTLPGEVVLRQSDVRTRT